MTASCCVLKPWHIQLCAASSKSGSSLKHVYAQCGLLVSQVNDQVSTAKDTPKFNVAGNSAAQHQCRAHYTATR